MATGTIEERLAAVEAELARLTMRLEGQPEGIIGRTNLKLIEEMFGVFSDSPLFDSVMRTIEENRERERQEAERADEATQI
jgi:hypothetical protein